MKSSNWRAWVFMVSSELKSLSSQWEVPIGGGGGYSWPPRLGYSMWFWQQNLFTGPSFCITMCVETKQHAIKRTATVVLPMELATGATEPKQNGISNNRTWTAGNIRKYLSRKYWIRFSSGTFFDIIFTLLFKFFSKDRQKLVKWWYRIIRQWLYSLWLLLKV